MENAALRVITQLKRHTRKSSASAAWEPFRYLIDNECGATAGLPPPSPITNKLVETDGAFTEFFRFGTTDEFLHGLSGLARDGLKRSMEAEARTNDDGKWWPEYEYVVLRAAEEDVDDLDSTAKFAGKLSLTGEQIVRDRGHAGMTLADFCARPEARDADLTPAEVAALRLYTGPLYAPLNAALRKLEIASWATTIACCYSGVLKLSFLSAPARVYRGVRETTIGLPADFITVEEGKFSGGVERAFMSTTKSPAVALDYAGGLETRGSIFVFDFDMASRGASVRWLSQYPHEDELLFPPCTCLSTLDVAQFERKRCMLFSVQVSTARPDTHDLVTPQAVPLNLKSENRRLALELEAEREKARGGATADQLLLATYALGYPDLPMHIQQQLKAAGGAVSHLPPRRAVVVTPEARAAWDAHGGQELEPLLAGAIAVVDASWLIAHEAAGGTMMMRQKLPPEAHLSLDELIAASDDELGLHLIAVSYPWLTPQTPDPKGSWLHLIASVLSHFVAERGGTRWGVLWDYGSVLQHVDYQAGKRLNRVEMALYTQGLSAFADFYAHPNTWGLLCTKWPAGYPEGYQLDSPPVPYFQRGWCVAEYAWSVIAKAAHKVLDLGQYSGTRQGLFGPEGIVVECTRGSARQPPLLPAEFAELIHGDRVRFSNKAKDGPVVINDYTRIFSRTYAAATALDFSYLDWTDVDGVQLAKVLASGALGLLETLSLHGNRFGDAAGAALAAVFADRDSLLPALVSVDLRRNAFSSEAVCALESAAVTADGRGRTLEIQLDTSVQRIRRKATRRTIVKQLDERD